MHTANINLPSSLVDFSLNILPRWRQKTENLKMKKVTLLLISSLNCCQVLAGNAESHNHSGTPNIKSNIENKMQDCPAFLS